MVCRRLLALVCLASLSVSCSKPDAKVEQGSAPPPVVASKPGACASGGGTVSDSLSAAYFPRVAGGYCIDPNGDARSYGEAAKGTLETVCTELLDGECEVYKNYGLKRVVTLRYVDGAGSPGTVNVITSRFASAEGAFAFFTKRVIADGDPADGTPKELPAGAEGFAPTIKSHSMIAISPSWAGKAMLETPSSYCGNSKPVKLIAR